MNNKKLGTNFERQLCGILAEDGYWVHFLSPDARGAQPFDVIAVKDGEAVAIDCKTCKDHIFRISRLEDNQVMAFEKWLACGNDGAFLAVLHENNVYFVDYTDLKARGKINLMEVEVVWPICANE